jgi:hypothetical protein
MLLRKEHRMNRRFAFTGLFALAMAAWCSCSLTAQTAPATATAAATASASTKAAASSYPACLLTKGDLTVTIYTPDAAKGYYRGPRFDWSSMMAVAYKGHTFFGPREGAKQHNPLADDHGIGPSEEFGMEKPYEPQGFADAKPGGEFLKIGVGLLKKPDKAGAKYFFRAPYEVDQTRWNTLLISPSFDEPFVPDRWSARSEGRDPQGYGCIYRKSISLADSGDAVIIERELKNTGEKPIETDHYAHNFITIDGAPVGEAYQIDLPFEPDPKIAKSTAKIDGKTVTFTGPYKNIWMQFVSPDAPAEARTAAANGFTVRNVRTGAAVAVKGDQPIEKFNFWSEDTVLCPEAFVVIKIAPGETFKWTTTYTFSVGEAK